MLLAEDRLDVRRDGSRHRRLHRLRDDVGLVRDILQRRLLHRAPREDEAEADRQRDTDDDDDSDRLEEPRAETRAAHQSVAMSL